MAALYNRSLSFDINPNQSWKLLHTKTGMELHSLPVRIELKVNGNRRILTLTPENTTVTSTLSDLAPFSNQAQVIHCQCETSGISLSVLYSLLDSHQLFLQKIVIENHSNSTISCGKITLIDNSFNRDIKFSPDNHNTGCFVNGWQSWSISGTYSAGMKQRIPGLKFIQGQQWHNASTPIPRSKGMFTSDFFTVLIDSQLNRGMLAGFLSQKQHFGHAEIDLRNGESIKLIASGDYAFIPPGHTMETDWAVVQYIDFSDPEPIKDYLDAAAMENHVALKPVIPVGWCSWYHYYTRITPDNLAENITHLQSLDPRIPIDLFQIDDGYQRTVGDWLEFKPEFQYGLAPIVAGIRSAGYTPGLWLAPFIVHPFSLLYQKHGEMLLRDRHGKPVNSAFNWNRFTTALDLSHPASQEYIQNVMDTVVNKWGFPYLKLDFLYAGALPGKHYDQTMTRAQVFDHGMKLIRETVTDHTYLLGCGAPIGSMIGYVDAMRIGADVSSDWEPKYNGIEILFPNEPNIPSVKNAMQNTVTRAWFHNHWWMNDPDCLLLRSTTNLTEDEICTQAGLTAMSGGLVLLSDDLAQIPETRMKLLRKILPVIGKTPQVIDWQGKFTPSKLRIDLENSTGDWNLISFTNWTDFPVHHQIKASDFHLEADNDWLVSSFWDSTVNVCSGFFDIGDLPPHATWVASVRKFTRGVPQYAGSDLHISQGLEVSSWIHKEGQIILNLRHNGVTDGNLLIYIPSDEIHIRNSAGRVVQLNNSQHLYRIPIHLPADDQIQIEFV